MSWRLWTGSGPEGRSTKCSRPLVDPKSVKEHSNGNLDTVNLNSAKVKLDQEPDHVSRASVPIVGRHMPS